ncbi:MAG: MBOAT family O-acyltransferase [Planctomycetota bacterium]
MFQALDFIRPTALPAILFLVWLPVFALLRGRHALILFAVSGFVTLVVVAKPLWALGLATAIAVGYLLVEGLARLRARRGAAGFVLLVGLHAAYWGCFQIQPPAAFRVGLRPEDQAGVFILFSGLGLTFFRLVSYTVDRLWRGAASLPPADFFAFMLFFPQFRHGPIERPHAFAPLLRQARQHWTPRDVLRGLARIGGGLGALVVAAVIASAAQSVLWRDTPRDVTRLLTSPEQLSLVQVLVLVHAPAVLLYALESGFASVQLGVSRAFAVHGTENFRQPFLAADPRTVWHRWNITLSAWLRDYAYIPLGGNRRHKYLNIVLVFVYAGLLHGFQLRCLVWGVWTGAGVALYSFVADRRGPRPDTEACRGPTRRVVAWLGRLATFHWFAIGVTIILDPAYCGLRVLHRYVQLISAGWVP